jgi:hypothetical protein
LKRGNINPQPENEGLRLLCVLAGFFLPAIRTRATVHYAILNSASPASFYKTRGTALADIRSAIIVSGSGDMNLMTNEVYQSGFRIKLGENRDRGVSARGLMLF